MRRATLTTGERADKLEQSKKLKKHVNECVRRVNASLQEASTPGALFSASSVGMRARLREACERAMLINPGSQDHQLEETLWRKVYYQPLSAAKEMKKGNSWSSGETCWVYSHLWDGVAFYHSLLQSLATNSHVVVDFLLPQSNEEKGVGQHTPRDSSSNSDSVARCLTCLGDLTRYMLDLPSPPPYHLSVRYYLQALHYNTEGGLIHSNLATVYSVSDQPLMAVAHYLRALTCEKIFEGAEGNLKRLLSKSRNLLGSEEGQPKQTPAHHQKRFLHTVLTLTSCLINNRSTEEVAGLCQDVLVQLGKALETSDDAENEVPDRSPSPPTASNGHPPAAQNGQDTAENNTENEQSEVSCLTPEVMIIVCTILSLCIKRLEKQGSSHTSMAQALMVSVLMTLISHVTSGLEQRISLIDPTFLSKLLPEEEKKVEQEKKASVNTEESENKDNSNKKPDGENAKKATIKKNQRSKRLSNLRRRRQRQRGDARDSDGSQDDSCSEASGSEEEGKENDDIVISSEEECEEEELDLSQLCSSEDDDSDEDVKIESDQEWEGLSGSEHLELISKEGMLSAVFVACDWMKREQEVIQLCVKTANSLWTAMAKLLNLLRVDMEQLRKDSGGMRSEVVGLMQESENPPTDKPCSRLVEALKVTPLPEDLMLHTLIPTYLSGMQNALNLKTMELVLLRSRRLGLFGQDIAGRQDTPLWLDSETRMYNFSLDRVITEEKDKTKKNDVGTTGRESSPSEEDLLSVPPAKKDSRRLAGLQSLTAQWLQHEVRSLEERTRRATLGLYLVPDASVLINNLQAIQLLLSKPTHMIIIPQAVIRLLDQQKKESLGARDAIRWLEIKFRHGSRFIRSQRPHERSHLPLIKYPKRKDKEAWEWYQIIECCHYLSAQVQQNSNNVKTATVTLLTGEKKLSSPTFSHSGLTRAAGAVLEHIEEFMSKWQTSSKGHS